ncbi:MAG: hypothetical protein ACMG6E_03350 [Candidatus Roizmanbacteria bacterium]
MFLFSFLLDREHVHLFDLLLHLQVLSDLSLHFPLFDGLAVEREALEYLVQGLVHVLLRTLHLVALLKQLASG